MPPPAPPPSTVSAPPASAPERAPRTVTLHDVARAAGVAPITASRALREPQQVAPETLARVQRAVAATGYIPNRLAGGLKSRRSRTVGALVPFIAVPQFLPTVQALTETLEQAGYQLILGQSGYNHHREAALLDTLLGHRVDAVVVAGRLADPTSAARLRTHGVPLVETWDLSEQPADMLVGFSHEAVGHAVAAFVRERGWHDVALATGDDARALRRSDGFVAGFGRAVPTATVRAPSRLALGRAALAELLASGRPLRAVVCSSDGLADGVMTEARARGLRIPQDLAVIGFGDADFAAHLEPGLTTVRIDAQSIGASAARLVLERLGGAMHGPAVIDVGFTLVQRGSTAL